MGLRRRNRTIHKDRVYLGRLIKPHALSGEIKFNPFGCDPGMLENVSPLRLESPDREVEVEYVRGSDNAPIVKFRGVDNREESQKLSGALVWTSEAGLPALEEENAYYEADFLFSRVVTVAGVELGEVVEVIETGASDVLVVRGKEGRESLLPANLEVVKEVRRAEQTIVVDPPLLEDELLPD
ncbi:MAG TPA: ribosome maturation factor RimM [bacterium]|nr:ribosome maturation factor RimM [bacterium]